MKHVLFLSHVLQNFYTREQINLNYTNQPKTSILISQRQTEFFLVCESLKKRMVVVDSPTIAFAKKKSV